eukprot:scaffold398275_cov27-Prasinocladus_malaysianus.AAC.1
MERVKERVKASLGARGMAPIQAMPCVKLKVSAVLPDCRVSDSGEELAHIYTLKIWQSRSSEDSPKEREVYQVTGLEASGRPGGGMEFSGGRGCSWQLIGRVGGLPAGLSAQYVPRPLVK